MPRPRAALILAAALLAAVLCPAPCAAQSVSPCLQRPHASCLDSVPTQETRTGSGARPPPLAFDRSHLTRRRCAGVRLRVTRDDPRAAPATRLCPCEKRSAQFCRPSPSPEGRSCGGREPRAPPSRAAGISPADARAARGEIADGERAAARVPASAGRRRGSSAK